MKIIYTTIIIILLTGCATDKIIKTDDSNTDGVVDLSKYPNHNFIEKAPFGSTIAIKGKIYVYDFHLFEIPPLSGSYYSLYPYEIRFNNHKVTIDGELIRQLEPIEIEGMNVIVIGTVKEGLYYSSNPTSVGPGDDKPNVQMKYLDVEYYQEIE